MSCAIGLQSYGIYIPHQRIELSEINQAWNRQGGRDAMEISL